MKFLKNTLAILALFAIGSATAKGLKKTEPVTTAPIRPQTGQPMGQMQPKPQQQPQLQKGTYRQFLTELRNMNVNDVFMPDKSKFTDKMIQFMYRVRISELEEIEKGSLASALDSLHVAGTVVPINEINNPNPNTQAKLDNLFEDAKERREQLEQELAPTKEPMTGQPNQQQMEKDLQDMVDLKLYHLIEFDKQGWKFGEVEILKLCRAISAMTEQAFKEQVADGLLRLPMIEVKIVNKLSELSLDTQKELIKYIHEQDLSKMVKDIGRQLAIIAKQVPIEEKEPMTGQPNQRQMEEDLQANVDMNLNSFIKTNKLGDMGIWRLCQVISIITEQAFKDQLADGLLRLPMIEAKIVNKLSELNLDTQKELIKYIKEQDLSKSVKDIGMKLAMMSTAQF